MLSFIVVPILQVLWYKFLNITRVLTVYVLRVSFVNFFVLSVLWFHENVVLQISKLNLSLTDTMDYALQAVNVVDLVSDNKWL